MWKKSERIKDGFSKDKNVYRVVSKIEWGLRMSEKIADNIENVSMALICWIGIFCGGGIMLSSYWGMEGTVKILAYIMLIVGIISWVLLKKSNLCIQITSRQMIVILSVLCLVYKTSVVLLIKTNPVADYLTFDSIAKIFAERGDLSYYSRYMSLYPHVFGYSYVLGIIYKIFGTSEIVVPVMNVVLSYISLILIYKILQKLYGAESAFWGGILWVFCPSQSIWNSTILSEPLYNMFVLLALYLCIILVLDAKYESLNSKTVLFYVTLSGTLVILNFLRPISAIFIIIIAVTLFVCSLKNTSKKKILWKLVCFLLVCITYFAGNKIVDIGITRIIGEEPSRVPGASLYLGSNENTNGQWNQEDWDKILNMANEENATGKITQEKVMEEALVRIKSINNPVQLLLKKFVVFWGNDQTVIAHTVAGGFEISGMRFDLLCAISNAFLLFITTLSLVNLWDLGYNKNVGVICVVLFLIGLTMSQMLVEVMGRYHYSGISVLIILSAGAFRNGQIIMKREKENDNV